MSKIQMIGNAHLDPAWMWRMPEGIEAFLATCRSALDRIAETSEFIFTCSSAAHYEFVLQTDPELFARIKEAVTNGKWCVVGGWWVEADCNLPCGESFARQALYGQRFFIAHFGKPATVGYCIDSFGHNANLPQLLKRAGMDSYVFMRPNEEEKHLKANLFRWAAPSGDSVLAYRLPLHYANHTYSSKEKIEKLKQFEEFGRHPWMLFYGVGNHGGGPTKIQIAEILEARKLDNEICFGDPVEFFENVLQVQPEYRGDFQPHAIGCYSAHSEIKRLNRLVEHELLIAERMSVVSEKLCGFSKDQDGLTHAWKNVCFNQFHDLLGGVAIPEAMDDAISMYREALAIAQRATRVAVQRIASNINTQREIESLIVFNPTAMPRNELVEFELWHPDASEKGMYLQSLSITDLQGDKMSVQMIEASGKIGGDRVGCLVRVSVPALGYSTYSLKRKVGDKLKKDDAISLSHKKFDSLLALRVRPEVFNDETDTWGHGATGFTESIGEFETTETEVIEKGPLRSCMRVESTFDSSDMIEDWYLDESADQLDVHVRLNWQEKRRLLKFRIRHGLEKPIASYEIPYAVSDRPAAFGQLGPEEYPGQSWVFVSESNDRIARDGIGVITDSKYSYSVDAKYLYITVARSPIFAHHSPPHEMFPDGAQRYLDQGEQEFHIRIVLHAASWQRARMPQRAQEFLEPLISHLESGHNGSLPRQSVNTCLISNPNVQLTVLKRSEENDGYIARLVETAGLATKAQISISLLAANWETAFGPFEIKTFHIGASGVKEVNLIER